MGANNKTCSFGQIQTGLPIPADIPYFSTAGIVNDPDMIACCSPNPVNLVESCYLWCRLPSSYANLNREDAGDDFSGCLDSRGRRGSSFSVNIPEPRRSSAERTVVRVWKVLVVTGIVFMKVLYT